MNASVSRLLMLVPLLGLGAQLPTDPRPSLFLSATSSDPMTFAQALSNSGRVVGIVVNASVRRRPTAGVVRGRDARDEGLAVILDRFNVTNPDIQAADVNGDILIRARDVPPAIDTVLNLSPDSLTDTRMKAAQAIFALAGLMRRGRATPPGGFIGGRVHEGCNDAMLVSIPRTAKTVPQALNEIVRQAKGLVWTIFYDLGAPANKLEIGYSCPDGSTSRITVPGW